jgi:glycine/D-amino acid oxidase-like deaminating enzyme
MQSLSVPRNFDVVVVGGGLVGMAIAYGLVRDKLRVAVCDGEDTSYRAARSDWYGFRAKAGAACHMPSGRSSRRNAGRRFPHN